MYSGKDTQFVTKLFRHTNLRDAYKTRNTIGQLLRHRHNSGKDDHLKNLGIYQLTCPDCDKKYIGQMGRSFCVRYGEHLRDYKFRTGNSKFAQHLHDCNHAFGPINTVMDILYTIKKGAMMDTLGKYHIYRVTSLGTQINETPLRITFCLTP